MIRSSLDSSSERDQVIRGSSFLMTFQVRLAFFLLSELMGNLYSVKNLFVNLCQFIFPLVPVCDVTSKAWLLLLRCGDGIARRAPPKKPFDFTSMGHELNAEDCDWSAQITASGSVAFQSHSKEELQWRRSAVEKMVQWVH